MSDELYRRLNVSSKASTDEIKKAYREMARQHHPDKGGDAEVFKGVQEAHEVLSDPDRRRMYDATGSARQDTQQQGGFPGFPGFPFGQGGFPEEIFRMFGGGGAAAGGGGRAQKGPDRHTQATIGLDAFYN
jgi:DnaJ-class molecular chaperone